MEARTRQGPSPIAVTIKSCSALLRRSKHRHLAQGAPTSPALANLACYEMDARLAGAARAVGVNYTRYADDLAFSGEASLGRRAQQIGQNWDSTAKDQSWLERAEL